MFGNNNTKKDSGTGNSPKNGAANAPTGHALNSLTQGTVIEGTIRAATDIRIDGTIKGKLFCDAKVIIGPTGVVEGEVKCQNAVVEGRFDGTITVEELLNVRESATLNGDVRTGKLVVQSGGIFNVSSCVMGGQSQQANTNGRANADNPLLRKDDHAKAAKAPA